MDAIAFEIGKVVAELLHGIGAYSLAPYASSYIPIGYVVIVLAVLAVLSILSAIGKEIAKRYQLK